MRAKVTSDKDKKEFYEKLAENIKSRRESLKLTQFDLAVDCRVTPMTILRWESGKCYIDSFSLVDLSKSLDIDILELLPKR